MYLLFTAPLGLVSLDAGFIAGAGGNGLGTYLAYPPLPEEAIRLSRDSVPDFVQDSSNNSHRTGAGRWAQRGYRAQSEGLWLLYLYWWRHVSYGVVH